MALTPNKDSYVETIEEADALAKRNFMSTDVELMAWDALSTEDKEVALVRSCTALSRFPYKGEKKYGDSQKLDFPRKVQSLEPGIYPILFIDQNYDNRYIDSRITEGNDGLDKAKLAQVVNAVYSVVLRPKARQSASIQIQGLKGISSGPKSESYGSNSGYQANQMSNAQADIYTDLVERVYLREWIITTGGRVG